MTLYEKQRSQRQWQEKLQQERRNISASVEETLTFEMHEQWDEDDEYYQSGSSGKNTALIPPRLSMQSKMLPALHSGEFVQSATAAHVAYQQEQQRRTTPNILARIAQRLTASFPALSLPQAELSVSPYTSTPASSQSTTPTGVSQQQADLPPQSYEQGTEKPVTPSMKVVDAIPAMPSTRLAVPFMPPSEPQRLAGRTTKVRLRAASLPFEVQMPTVAYAEPVNHVEGHQPFERVTASEPVVLDARDVSRASTRPDLPIVARGEEQVERKAITGGTYFGTHTFENGQAEVMVLQEKVKDSSVVHVTLTSNPGQTLVQYISLHPQYGFTVHLTAPANAKTTFNYVVFVP